MEKEKAACDKSPTLEENWLKDELSKRVCDGTYDEKNKVPYANESEWRVLCENMDDSIEKGKL